MKVVRAAAKAKADALEGNQKRLNQYDGVEEANPLNIVLLSVRGEVGADKNGGDKGSTNSGRGCGSVSIRPLHCVKLTLTNGFVYCTLLI